MSTEALEELVVKKLQAEQAAYGRLGLLGAMVLTHGKPNKRGAIEYRLTKARREKIEGYRVEVRGLATGGVVITAQEISE